MSILKIVLFGFAGLLAAAGQFFILAKGAYVAGMALTVFAVAAAAAVHFTPETFFSSLASGILGLALKLRQLAAGVYDTLQKKAAEKKAPEKAVAKKKKTEKEIKPKNSKTPAPLKPAGFFPFKPKQAATVQPAAGKATAIQPVQPEAERMIKREILVHKNVLLVLFIVCLILTQAAFFTSKMVLAILLAAGSLVSGIYYLTAKQTHYTVSLEFKYGKAAGVITGLAILVAGWILLLMNTRIAIGKISLGAFGTQHLGFWIGFIGAYLIMINIPLKSKVEAEIDTEFTDVDLRYKWVKDYRFKILFALVTMFFFWLGGYKYGGGSNEPLMIMSYMAAFVFLILTVPVADRYIPAISNKYLNFIVKIAAAAAAFIIAYQGQKLFYEYKLEQALTNFYIAGAILIVFFPPAIIFKEQGENEKLGIKTEIVLLLAIMALGAYLRIHEINIRPVGIENDEAGGVITIYEKWNNLMVFRLFRYSLYFYIMEPILRFMGLSHLSLKMQGILMGTLTIPAVYFVIRYIFNSSTAVIVTLMFAVARWHLHFSRSGHGTIMLPLTVAILLYFFYRGLKHRDKWNFFWAGLAGGLCWHGYRSGQLITFGLILFLIYKLLSEKFFIKRFWVGIFAFSVGFWLFSGPVFQFWFTGKSLIVGRPNDVSVFSHDPNAPKNPIIGVYENTKKVFLMFNYRGDERQRNTGMQPGTREVDFTTGIFFFLGLIYGLYYWRDNRYMLFILTFISITAASIFSIEAPSGFRTFGAIPIVFFYAAIPIFLVTRLIHETFSKKVAIVLILLFAVPVSVAVVKENYKSYFQTWVGGMDEVSTRSGEYLAKYGKGYASVLLGGGLGYTGHPPFRIWTWGYDTGNTSIVTDCFPERRTKSDGSQKGFIYLASVRYKVAMDYIKKFYSGTEEFDEHPAFGRWFNSLVIPAENVLALRGVKAKYLTAAGTVIESDQKTIGFDEAVPAPCNVDFETSLFIERYGETKLTLDTNTTGYSVYLDGRLIMSDGKNTYESDIWKGLHKVRITASKRRAGDYIRLVKEIKVRNGNQFTPVLPPTPVPENDLFKINKLNGLIGTYYSSPVFEGSIGLKQLDPVILFDASVIPFPYAVKWNGYIRIPETGKYKFYLSTNGAYDRITINGINVFVRGKAPLGERTVTAAASPVEFVKGYYPIEIASSYANIVSFVWNTKDGDTDVPADVLFPYLKGN